MKFLAVLLCVLLLFLSGCSVLNKTFGSDSTPLEECRYNGAIDSRAIS